MIQRIGIVADQVTFEEFCDIVADGEKADLIDGAIYMASPDTRLSNNLTRFLCTLFADYLDARDLPGDVFVTRYAFKLSDVDSPEPDVAFVGPGRLHLVEERHMIGAPHLAVEIVSRDSRSRDYGEKRELYEASGVDEYWIINPVQQRVEFRTIVNGQYQLMPLKDNRIFRSQVIPGFWLDVNWLLARPVPRAYRCLEKILAEPAKPSRKRKR